MRDHHELTIERVGQRGEGVATGPDGHAVFTPYALPGDRAIVEIDGERGRLAELLTPSPQRVSAICPHFGVCGGCAVQALARAPYEAWKRDLVVGALAHAQVETQARSQVDALTDAHGAGRRRATFHARFPRDGVGRVRAQTGFMRARTHAIVEIDQCPILAPDMAGAIAAARALAQTLAEPLARADNGAKGDKALDLLVTATPAGLDIDLRGAGALDPAMRAALIGAAERLDLARLSNHGVVVIERRAPLLRMGQASLAPPPGAFLQATEAGEETLARLVSEAVGPAKNIADLFAGVGTFALRLAQNARVHAVESDDAALRALARAAHNAPGLRAVTSETRDLFRRPLMADELAPFDAVVFDPPRAGAQTQAQALAASTTPRVVAVSCNVQSFARDARLLLDGGYVCERVTPVDQFRYSPHVEMVGVFTRPPQKTVRRRRLLG